MIFLMFDNAESSSKLIAGKATAKSGKSENKKYTDYLDNE